MKRSQTSHDLLIRGLNTADVFCRCNIIIFSMRTQEAGLNKPCNLWSMEAPAESTKSNKFHWSSCLPDCASYICQSIRLLLQRALLSSHICSVPIERSRGSYYILRGIYRSISLLLGKYKNDPCRFLQLFSQAEIYFVNLSSRISKVYQNDKSQNFVFEIIQKVYRQTFLEKLMLIFIEI